MLLGLIVQRTFAVSGRIGIVGAQLGSVEGHFKFHGLSVDRDLRRPVPAHSSFLVLAKRMFPGYAEENIRQLGKLIVF